MKKRKILIFLMIGLVMLIIFRIVTGKKETKTAKSNTIPVKVMTVELKDLSRALDYVGTIKGKNEAIVYPKVNGKIVEKNKNDGDPIDKDEVIMYIDRDEVGLRFEKAPVESPLKGIIGRIFVDIGANVTPQTPVAIVTNMEKIEVELPIPQQYTPDVAKGEKAIITIDAYPDKVFRGTVDEISPVLDPETRSALATIDIEDPDKVLKSGMFVKVRLVLEEKKDIPVIIKESIMGKEPELYTYIIENNKAVSKNIKIGIHDGPFFEVLSGLKAGDKIVIMGQQKLRDGAVVSVED